MISRLTCGIGSNSPADSLSSQVAALIDDPPGNTKKFLGMLQQRGISRRRFVEFCGALAVSLGLSEAFVPSIQSALAEGVIGKTEGKLAPVIWLEMASCTGCTESFAQVDSPDIATVVLEMITLNYSETLSAGAGYSLEQALEETIEAGGHIVIVEGALMEGWNGNALRIGNRTSLEIIKRVITNCKAVLCVGSCAVDGGWQAAVPNPGGAIGVQNYLNKAYKAGEIAAVPPIINLPTCPSNPENVVAVLVDVLLEEKLPDMNADNKPRIVFNSYIHDRCERRGHFENGEFVYKFDSEEEKLGFCLYAMGCKGPQTKNDCPIVRWNRRVSWCVNSGAPCIGCSQADPMTTKHNWVDMNTPFLRRFRNIRIGDFVLQPALAAMVAGGVVAVALVAHGFGMKLTGRTKGRPFEKTRKWDSKHPDKAVSELVREAAASAGTARATAQVGQEKDTLEAAAAADEARLAAESPTAPTEHSETNQGGE